MKPLSREERAECELVLADMERRGLVERPGGGQLRLTAAGDELARQRIGALEAVFLSPSSRRPFAKDAAGFLPSARPPFRAEGLSRGGAE